MGIIMADQLDANSIHFSTGDTISYTALDQMLEQQNLFEVAKALNVPAQELMQVLKNRPRGE